MGSELIIVSIGSFIFGILITYFLAKKTNLIKNIRKLTKEERAISKIVNNPDLLLEKLNESAKKIIDRGEELKYSIVEKNGKKELVLEKIKISLPKKTGKPEKQKKSKTPKKRKV